MLARLVRGSGAAVCELGDTSNCELHKVKRIFSKVSYERQKLKPIVKLYNRRQ